ncbi:MAG: lysophospholipid acyltransferase family protein [bacterium]|nr:MAG: lysophospholipid acyltransferase family protein [bacterium]
MVSYLLYVIAATLIKLCPRKSATRFAAAIAFIFYSFRSRIRKNIQRNFAALGRTDAKTFVVFRNFSRSVADFLKLTAGRREQLVRLCRIRGLENLDEALEKGNGAILFCPHLGPWELAGAYLASLGYRIHTVALEHPSAGVTRFFSERRRSWGIMDYSIGECIGKLIQALRNGDVIVLLIDRNFTGNGMTVNFLGNTVTLPDGHIILSMRTAAPLLPCCCYYDENGSIQAIVDPAVVPSLESAPPHEVGQACIERIEAYIRAHPEQWFAFDHLWPE